MNKIYDILFKHPTRWIIYGPSGSGKSSFVHQLLLQSKELFGINFNCVIYCSGENFPSFNKINNIPILKCESFTRDYIDLMDKNNNNLIVLDDCMHEATNDILISDLFTKRSHHKNITVIILLQNLFPKSKYMRDISISSSYIVLMNNPREILQIKLLANQIDGDKSNIITEAYKNATKNKPYSYLLLDLCQTTPEIIKIRTNVLLDEHPKIVYVMNNEINKSV